MKYKLTDNTIIVDGKTLHQIQALKDFGNVQAGDFGNVQAGDLGGWIESENNLSQTNNAWVYGNAKVYGNAWVYGDAEVAGNAWVYGNAKVYGDAWVSGNTSVYGDAEVYGNAAVYGDAEVYGDAKVAQKQHIRFNRVLNDITDISINLLENIEAQTGLKSFNNEIYCYKHVREDLSSLHDPDFKHTVGEYVTVDKFDTDQTKSCSSGLHVSNAQYWNSNKGQKILFCRVHIDDILAVQEGKIRCKRLFVIGVCDGLVF